MTLRRRPAHLHPGFVLIVMTGGALGTVARYGLGLVLPAPPGWPLATLAINLVGAFVLGALLEGLTRRGPDTGCLRFLRLLLGTGFLGAFTTYSAFAVDAVMLFEAGRPTAALVYVSLSLFGGIVAALAGIWAAARLHGSSGHHCAALQPKTGETSP